VGENGVTSKIIFEVQVFFSSQNRLPLLFEETIGAFLFSFFHNPSPEDSGVLMIFEDKITFSKTSF
jgi:hypothetical protein